jgi:hypothetical protein
VLPSYIFFYCDLFHFVHVKHFLFFVFFQTRQSALLDTNSLEVENLVPVPVAAEAELVCAHFSGNKSET